jgi:hypothetical protein
MLRETQPRTRKLGFQACEGCHKLGMETRWTVAGVTASREGTASGGAEGRRGNPEGRHPEFPPAPEGRPMVARGANPGDVRSPIPPIPSPGGAAACSPGRKPRVRLAPQIFQPRRGGRWGAGRQPCGGGGSCGVREGAVIDPRGCHPGLPSDAPDGAEISSGGCASSGERGSSPRSASTFSYLSRTPLKVASTPGSHSSIGSASGVKSGRICRSRSRRCSAEGSSMLWAECQARRTEETSPCPSSRPAKQAVRSSRASRCPKRSSIFLNCAQASPPSTTALFRRSAARAVRARYP